MASAYSQELARYLRETDLSAPSSPKSPKISPSVRAGKYKNSHGGGGFSDVASSALAKLEDGSVKAVAQMIIDSESSQTSYLAAMKAQHAQLSAGLVESDRCAATQLLDTLRGRSSAGLHGKSKKKKKKRRKNKVPPPPPPPPRVMLDQPHSPEAVKLPAIATASPVSPRLNAVATARSISSKLGIKKKRKKNKHRPPPPPPPPKASLRGTVSLSGHRPEQTSPLPTAIGLTLPAIISPRTSRQARSPKPQSASNDPTHNTSSKVVATSSSPTNRKQHRDRRILALLGGNSNNDHIHQFVGLYAESGVTNGFPCFRQQKRVLRQFDAQTPTKIMHWLFFSQKHQRWVVGSLNGIDSSIKLRASRTTRSTSPVTVLSRSSNVSETGNSRERSLLHQACAQTTAHARTNSQLPCDVSQWMYQHRWAGKTSWKYVPVAVICSSAQSSII